MLKYIILDSASYIDQTSIICRLWSGRRLIETHPLQMKKHTLSSLPLPNVMNAFSIFSSNPENYRYSVEIHDSSSECCGRGCGESRMCRHKQYDNRKLYLYSL